VTPVTPALLPETDAALCFVCILLIPCAIAGLALINTGLGRSRNAAHSMLGSLFLAGLAAVVYVAVGFAWQGYATRPSLAVMVVGKAWSWIGSERFFLRGMEFDGSPITLVALFGIFAAGLAAVIPVGSAAERWRLDAACASTALLAGFTYPLFAHWTWGGGWLAQLGANYGLGRGFIDSGGAASIQAAGGLAALSITWILGPRRGKYSSDGIPAAIPGHHAIFVLLGCFLAWFGWLGLDCAGAFLFSGGDWRRVTLVALNTTLSAAAALLAVAWITRIRYRKVDASLCANGWVGGLVAGSAGCAVIRPEAAIMIGLIAGALIVFSVEFLELRLRVDDPGGAVSVHAIGGMWGILATGLFAQAAGEGQWVAQLVGVATLIGFVLPVTFGLNWLLNRVLPQRAAPEGERQGMDLHELGAGAYPDFVSHKDEMW
jgi:Amt family ammonium transporter